MDKLLKIAVMLSAVDRMSNVIGEAVDKSNAKLASMKKRSDELFGKGAGQLAAGAAIAASLTPVIAAYSELEDSTVKLKTAMMGSDGSVAVEFEKVNSLAIKLGNKLPGTTADFQNMFEVLLNNGIPAQTILEGVGEGAAYLAVALKLPYDEAGKLAAKLKEATGVANQDMMAFLDTIAKTKNMGVETGEMQYAFGRSAGALKLMKVQGLEASKSIAAVYATLIRSGLSGETVGTGMSSVFNSILDEKKMGKARDAAKALGVNLQFMKNGKFVGVEEMMKQLDKLGKFDAEKRASVVNALTGGGQDGAMLQILIDKGVKGYNEIHSKMEGQASLNQKVTAQLGTLANIWEATTGTITNMLAAIGEAIGPELKMIADLIGQAAGKMQEFFSLHPKLAKFLALTIAGVGIFMMVVGVINLIRGAVVALNLILALNPFILVAMAAIAAVALIYTYWDEIKGFFLGLWDAVKVIFQDAATVLTDIALAPVRAIEYAINKVKSFTGLGSQSNLTGVIDFQNRLEKGAQAFQGTYNATTAAPNATPTPTPNAKSNTSTYAPVLNFSGPVGPMEQKKFGNQMEQQFKEFETWQKRDLAKQFQ